VIFGDLADLDEIRGVAQQAAEFGRFDAVIHNAGAFHRPEAVTVNTVAPYMLTALRVTSSGERPDSPAPHLAELLDDAPIPAGAPAG
jgi:hypothetical protein